MKDSCSPKVLQAYVEAENKKDFIVENTSLTSWQTDEMIRAYATAMKSLQAYIDKKKPEAPSVTQGIPDWTLYYLCWLYETSGDPFKAFSGSIFGGVGEEYWQKLEAELEKRWVREEK